MPAAKPQIAILISGRGSNMAAIIEAAQNGRINADVICVISNEAEALGLERAKAAGIKTHIIPHKNYPSRMDFEAALHEVLKACNPDIICLAGFMRILGAEFIQKWEGRIINIHPSLLPKYKGLHTHQRAIEAGDKKAGCTVHFVTAELDAGAPILQTEVSIEDDDTAETLAAKVLAVEHQTYINALKKLLD